MYQSRQAMTKKIPLPRKGTKYIVRSSSHIQNSVPVVIAIRDMLNLAKSSREVKEMIKEGLLTLNWKPVKNLKESVRIFNVIHADKDYRLIIGKNKKFSLEEIKDDKKRVCRVIGKSLIRKGIVQLGLHDGHSVEGDNKIKVNDSVYLDDKGKIVSHSAFEKGKKVFVFSGKYTGFEGKIKEIRENYVVLDIKDKEEPVVIPVKQVLVE